MLISEQWPGCLSCSQVLRGGDNARSLVRAKSQQILVPCNQQIRFRKGGALQKLIVAGIAAFLYRAPNLHTDATRQNRLQRRCCPVLVPGKLFRQDAHDLRVNLIAGCNHVFAHRFFERQSRRAATFRKLKRRNPDVCIDDDDHPLDRTLRRRGFSARTS